MAKTTMQGLIDSAIDELKDREWDEEAIPEIANYFVPVYIWDLLDLVQEDCNLLFVESEYGEGRTAEQCLRLAIYSEIERGLNIALGAYRATVEDDTEDAAEDDDTNCGACTAMLVEGEQDICTACRSRWERHAEQWEAS